ncbi:MAG: hypothetical protein ACFHVJ_09455 [Aestuariibacter sp.]
MVEVVAPTVVSLAAIFMLGLACAAFLAPKVAVRFLNSFASSGPAHYTEMFVRLVIGWSLIEAAPYMLYSEVFSIFGWVVIITSGVLLLLPWRLHHRFAQIVVPFVTRRVRLFGLLALPFGATILYSVLFLRF